MPNPPSRRARPSSRTVRAAIASAPALALTAILALAAAAPPPAARAAEAERREAAVAAALPVFERPVLQRRLRGVTELFRRGDAVGAELGLTGLISRYPAMASLRLAQAQLRARRGDLAGAELSLRMAAERGLRGAQRLETPLFAGLRGRPGYEALRQALSAPPPEPRPQPPAAAPAPLEDGEARVTPANSEWSDQDGAVRAYFAPPRASERPGPVMQAPGPAALELNRLAAAGRAAGNTGDFYENRDDEHSMLDLDRFPQITPVEHGRAAQRAGFARALPDGLAISAGSEAPPLFGNASVAVTSKPLWRSMARMALTEPGRAAELWRQYSSNQIYLYPEHKDHDPFFGDVFPANTPYYIVSQGSSYSDRRAMESVAMILAAFRPETKARLIRERLIAPTVQMIWRRGQRGIESDAAYLSGEAHPTVFEPDRAEPERMVRLANALAPEEIPPMVRLSVLQESRPTPGVELFGDGLSETLLDTPSAVARVMRGTGRTKTLTVSAAGTRAPHGTPPESELRFRWTLLRGDPERVRITPLGARGEGAEIEVDWHDETETPISGIRSQRVDIGVFAHNGAQWSAPAFVSVAFPPRQRRVWDEAGRLESVAYDAVDRQSNYADPWIYPQRGWRDLYRYDADGAPLGWRRETEAGAHDFTRHGARVESRDDRGRAQAGRLMSYPMGQGDEGRRRVLQRPRPLRLLYDYDGPEDRQGAATPQRDAQ